MRWNSFDALASTKWARMEESGRVMFRSLEAERGWICN